MNIYTIRKEFLKQGYVHFEYFMLSCSTIELKEHKYKNINKKNSPNIHR